MDFLQQGRPFKILLARAGKIPVGHTDGNLGVEIRQRQCNLPVDRCFCIRNFPLAAKLEAGFYREKNQISGTCEHRNLYVKWLMFKVEDPPEADLRDQSGS